MEKLNKTLTAPLLAVVFLLGGCATLQKGADPLAVNAERAETVMLTVVDGFLKYEYDNRASAPDIVKNLAAKFRKGNYAKKTLMSLDRVRIAYKQGRESRSEVLKWLATVEGIIDEVKLWIPPTSRSGEDSPPGLRTDQFLLEAQEASVVSSKAGWLTAVPMVMDLAKHLYSLGRDIAGSLKQDREWTPEEDSAFRRKLISTTNQKHWQ